LWAECSDAASLARHLDGFGEIRITRLEPETAVAWEGERARGTVRIEPAGWGTKVILTAVAEGDETVVPTEPDPTTEPEPLPTAEALSEPPMQEPPMEELRMEEPPMEEPPVEAPTMGDPPVEAPPPPARKRRFARLRAYWRGERLAEPDSAPVEEPPPVEEPSPVEETAPAEEPAAVQETPPSFEESPALEAPPAVPETPAPVVSDTEATLAAALDSLGQAHHRPYSRA
jgi:hypothetical protein